jgi:cytoskeletal protein CcmA (bactofilin family)
VEGVIDPKGNRLTVGPNGRVKADVNASVVVQGKQEGDIQASDRVDLVEHNHGVESISNRGFSWVVFHRYVLVAGTPNCLRHLLAVFLEINKR